MSTSAPSVPPPLRLMPPDEQEKFFVSFENPLFSEVFMVEKSNFEVLRTLPRLLLVQDINNQRAVQFLREAEIRFMRFEVSLASAIELAALSRVRAGLSAAAGSTDAGQFFTELATAAAGFEANLDDLARP